MVDGGSSDDVARFELCGPVTRLEVLDRLVQRLLRVVKRLVFKSVVSAHILGRTQLKFIFLFDVLRLVRLHRSGFRIRFFG